MIAQDGICRNSERGRGADLGNQNPVTTGNCACADQNVRWVRAVFGGGLIDGASRDSIESGAFCFSKRHLAARSAARRPQTSPMPERRMRVVSKSNWEHLGIIELWDALQSSFLKNTLLPSVSLRAQFIPEAMHRILRHRGTIGQIQPRENSERAYRNYFSSHPYRKNVIG